jgi:siroheme synthase (precorrin-2 oxidase/ferrochelatase)
MKKTFDAVEEMRSIREKLQKEYEANPELRRRRLEQIHKKYKMTKSTRNPLRSKNNELQTIS